MFTENLEFAVRRKDSRVYVKDVYLGMVLWTKNREQAKGYTYNHAQFLSKKIEKPLTEVVVLREKEWKTKIISKLRLYLQLSQ